MDGTLTPTYSLNQGDGLGFGGGSGIWLFAILALFFFGNGGWGNRSNAPTDYARQSDVVYTSAFNQLQSENSNIISEIQRVGYDNMANVKDQAYSNLSEIRDVQAAVSAGFANQQTCCCNTLRAIDGVNYNLATQSAAIQANDTANTQKVLDAIASNRMADMQNQINALQLQLATNTTVKYPTTTAFSVASPCFGGCGYSSI